MSALHIRRAYIAAATLLCGWALSACPFPIPPGFHYGTRENIGEEVPSFVIPGKTTRADVLFLLGEADGVALDESWLSYGYVHGSGGVVLLLGAYGEGGLGVEAVEHHRLVLYFDERSVVARTQFEKRLCPKMVGHGGSRRRDIPSCLDFSGRDLPIIRTLQ